jgi:hypothetical protein
MLALQRQVDLNVTMEKLDRLTDAVNKLTEKKQDKKSFVKFESMTDYSIRSIEERLSDLEKAHRKSVDYALRYTPKLVRNMLNESLNRVLIPSQLR